MQNHFEIHAKMYKLWPGQAQFMTILTSVTLTFNLPEKMFQMALFLFENKNCA